MAAVKSKTIYFPHFSVSFTTNDKKIGDLILSHFPLHWHRFKKNKSLPLYIRFRYYRTNYTKIPRLRTDCFRTFALFYNQSVSPGRIHLDAGPRTLRTNIDIAHNRIDSFIATPPDFEKDLLFDLIFFQPLKYSLERKGFFLFHASCIAKDNKAVLFTGPSGSGKSVLSLSFLTQGFDYLSDDEVILRRKGQRVVCSPFLSFPKINKKLLFLFPEFKKTSPNTSGKKEKVKIDIRRFDSKLTRGDVLPRLLIFPKYTKTRKAGIESLNKKAVFNRLLREEFMYIKPSFRHVSIERFKLFLDLLSQVKVCRLYYNDQNIRQAAELVSEFLKSS